MTNKEKIELEEYLTKLINKYTIYCKLKGCDATPTQTMFRVNNMPLSKKIEKVIENVK